MEKTSTESNNAIISVDDETEALTVGNANLTNSYTSFLPSLQLKANVNENLIARGSWTNNIGRPDYSQLSGVTELSFQETTDPGIYEGNVSLANPNLKPYESRNFDLSLEQYFLKGGMIAVGGFYKKIKNQIYESEFRLENTTYEGRNYSELEFNQLRNAGNANLYGLEFTYDQPLTFLPEALNGLGISANFALIHSKVSLPNRPEEKLPLFRQANNVYNAALYYQKKAVEIRLATSHRSKYLTEAASPESYEAEMEAGVPISAFDRYEAARTTYDFSASYIFKKYLRITGQVRNLTNEPEQAYQGSRSRYDRHDLTGRSFFLGLTFNY